MLSIIQVGNNAASNVYVRNNMRAVNAAGMKAELIRLPETASTKDVVGAIRKADYTDGNTAILVQLPLPSHINKKTVIKAIPIDKDIDGLHPWSRYYPLTPCAIIRYLEDVARVDLQGKKVTILGRSKLVGLPLAEMMIKAGATVTVCNSHTHKWYEKALCNLSDIIVTAVGKANTITAEDIYGTGQIIIDVGINRNTSGRLCGDVSPVARMKLAESGGYCSPVPGGVGKWTVEELVLRLGEMEERR